MKIKYNTFIIITICVSTILGCFLYCLGFSKKFGHIEKHSPLSNPYINEMFFDDEEQKKQYLDGWFPKSTKKIFLYLVDSLRYDQVTDIKKQRERFITDQNGEVVYFPSNFTSITERLNNDRNNSLLVRGVVDTQTMTITRIKALSTGTIPSFMSMFDQISSEGVIQDNLFYQLKQRTTPQEVIYLYGVDLWNQYFSKYFDFQRLNINSNLQKMIDNSPVFNQEILKNHLQNPSQSNWTFFINHDGGIDSLMHGEVIYRFEKPFESPLYQHAIEICNNATRDFIEAIDNDTTFILFSDHGFTNYGTHGGKEIEERLSVIFGYDKRGFVKDRNISQKMDKLYLDSETDQIDILATICMLKGIAIPSNNIGVIIPDFFLDLPSITNTVIANAYYTNMRQIEDYFDESIIHNPIPSKKTQENIKDICNEIQVSYKKLFTEGAYTGSQDELSSFISSVINLSNIAKESARNEGEIRISWMYLSSITIGLVLVVSVSYILYNDSIVSHNYTSQDKHLTQFLLLKFILASFLLHLLVFFMFSGIHVFLLINVGLIAILLTIVADIFYARYKLYNKPKHLLKGLKIFQSFKLDFQTLITTFSLISFCLLFLSAEFVDELDYYVFIITAIILVLFSVQLLLSKGRIFSQKIQIFIKIIQIGLMSFFCMYLDPFIQKDEKKQYQKTHLNTDFIKLLSYEAYNTVIPLIFFCFFYFFQIRESLKQCPLSKKRQSVFYTIHTAIYSLLAIYFVSKNNFHDSSAVYFFRNFFPLSSYVLILFQVLYMMFVEKHTLTFIQKYKLFIWSILPSFLYLMDYQGITLIIFFFLTISLFQSIISFLNYRPYSLLYIYVVIISFQYFYVSGHKLAFEFMHLHTHAVGLFIHSDFFSNVNVFIGNYSFFVLSFIYFPIILHKETQLWYPEFNELSYPSNTKGVSDSKQTNPIPPLNDSIILSRDHQHDLDNLLSSPHVFDQNEQQIFEEIDLTPEQAEIKVDLLFSKSLVFINLPIIFCLLTSFFRNIHYPLDKLQEQYSTIIIFLTTIFLLSSISATIHLVIQVYFSSIDLRKKYLKIH